MPLARGLGSGNVWRGGGSRGGEHRVGGRQRFGHVGIGEHGGVGVRGGQGGRGGRGGGWGGRGRGRYNHSRSHDASGNQSTPRSCRIGYKWCVNITSQLLPHLHSVYSSIVV